MFDFKSIKTPHLDIPQWQIKSGECWAVLGRNGSGKQYLTHLLMGKLNLPATNMTSTQGSIAALSFEQQQAFYEEELKADDTDFMDHLDPGTTVRQLLELESALPATLGFLNLEKILDRGYRLLSSGESRKTLLAQALLQEPSFLILDEPYDSLDIQSKENLSKLFQSLLLAGKTQLLFLLNSFEEISEWHTHVAIMEKGQIIAQGLREDIINNPEITALLSFDQSKLPTWPEPFEQQSSPDKIVVLSDGKVAYGDTVIFEHINLAVEAGEHTLITGANGSGKSTVLGLITGDHPQCYGNDLTVLDYSRGSGESIWQIKKQIGIVTPELHRNHRVPGSALHIVLSGFFDTIGLYQEYTPEQASHAQRWLELVGLGKQVTIPFKNLSYGEQRLVLIARALVKQPALLILDEPTQGLDDINRHRLLYFLEHLAGQKRTTIMMASHRLDERLELFVNFLEM